MCNIDAIRANAYHDEVDKASTGIRQKIDNEFKSLKLSDLRVISTLGVGGFGRVCISQCAITIILFQKKKKVNIYIQ